MHVCNAFVLFNTNTRLTLLIRANNKNSKLCMTARSAILVQCANGTLHTAELGFFPLQSRAHRLHEVIGTQHFFFFGTVAVLCNASATRTVRASVDVIVRHSGADRYPDPSKALLLSGNVTGNEPANCICILAAECRSVCVQ